MFRATSSRVLLAGVLMAFVVGVVGAISFAGGGAGPGGGPGVGPCYCEVPIDDNDDGYCDECGGCIPDPVGDGPKGPKGPGPKGPR